MGIKEIISKDVAVPLSIIEDATRSARQLVKKFSIPKRDGSLRLIFQPSKKLKLIQYWLIINVFRNLPVHEAAYAYKNDLSILDNAQLHSNNKYFVKLDLQDFFPSITFNDLLPKIKKWHLQANTSWPLDQETTDLIRLSCFFLNDRLAIGFPSSPIISNIVMYEFDASVCEFLNENLEEFGDVVYTRYADDLVFSTNKKGVSQKIINGISKIISNSNSPKIKINLAKTKVGSSTGGSASVTGLKVCEDGHITIHRKQKDHIRLLLSLYKKNKLNPDELESLKGHLAYVYHVDSSFYTKLQLKFFEEIATLKFTT